MTTRGMKEEEAEKIAHLIADILLNIEDETVMKRALQEVRFLTKAFPVYTSQ